MKVLFDTNIIIDILKRREPHFEKSNEVFMFAIDGKIESFICVSAITDIFYILRKEYTDTKTMLGIIFDILEIVKPIDVFVRDIYNAAKLDFLDFEDAVTAAVAQREKADYIITRNKRDFLQSFIPAITPDEFLHLVRENPI